MTRREALARLLASRAALRPPGIATHKAEAEGGCGVVGIACSEALPGRHLLQALEQMRNRGNGKGGGIAMVGLDARQLGVSQAVLERDYLLSIAYLEPGAREEVEREHIRTHYTVDHAREVPHVEDWRALGLEAKPPDVWQYFVRPRPEVVAGFRERHGLGRALAEEELEDEVVYQASYALNRACYAALGEKRAFVLSHGKNIAVLKLVGHGDDVVRYYKLEDARAHVWIGHHRYPTKGKVWHPGGAHPFVGLHEALVHNGDFANYASICQYLAQRGIYPLFLTDTEVSVLLFDLLHRLYRYPLEHVIEALAPTTERDFAMLPAAKRELYRMLQATHIHGSPDGPWFFLIAQSDARGAEHAHRLIGITDTSMLRPQVFALQEGHGVAVGLAASEKQAIDAVLGSLAAEDPRFGPRADKYWNARGGSHTDGGAFVFSVRPRSGSMVLECTDKFGRRVGVDGARKPYVPASWADAGPGEPGAALAQGSAEDAFRTAVAGLPAWTYGDLLGFLGGLEASAREPAGFERALGALTLLLDRRYPTGSLRRSSVLGLLDASLERLFEGLRARPLEGFVSHAAGDALRAPARPSDSIVVDARGFASEGDASLAAEVVRLHRLGWRRFLLAGTRGHRFLANGLGPRTQGTLIHIYGSPGDYLASGIDGAHVEVHNSGQDQLAQIMKSGSLVVHGDVGQTFLYGAKGGKVFVLGNAAGRPLINAVGNPRVVINGTCLDYLAESFMAGDPLQDGGFCIVNGIGFDDDGAIVDLESPYPGGNLFSLASGGALYVRDPRRVLEENQLNGGEFAELSQAEWALIKPYLEENERRFGIPVERLLSVDGKRLPPERAYRKVKPARLRALEPEEAWVRRL